MTLTDIARQFQPGNDPEETLLPKGTISDVLSTDPDIVGPEELRGLTISDAEDAYVGVRRAEAINTSYHSGTKHERAKRQYRLLLQIDRVARQQFEQPAVGMQTVVFDPTQFDRVLDPIAQATITTEGVERSIRRTRDRLDGERYVYFGVRDIDSNGQSHWHVYWCLDQVVVAGDSLDLYAGIEAHIRHATGADYSNHPATEAVKWDPYPNQTAEEWGSDRMNGGAVHPCARYVAGSLPHIGVDGEMSPKQIRHGVVEWGRSDRTVRVSRRNALPVEFEGMSGFE
ncbi:hypothetical protein NDI76_11515 [Halogeometricum sp. S1BR25-6]|uniref:Uncharacterized protein n=1 Tax=Halogeometricum salsisoli TaxID=2950536 RepID=A0ABU2GEY9_9EURY|nr:hypothetical protein [Halogeometricum sp. S1BR25-6]MDS0299370.1 hypothetical protein [Halogeometricum sp. S1BR25-6]